MGWYFPFSGVEEPFCIGTKQDLYDVLFREGFQYVVDSGGGNGRILLLYGLDNHVGRSVLVLLDGVVDSNPLRCCL